MTLANIYLNLGAAIAAEVVATTPLKRSDGFTRLVPGRVPVVSPVPH